MTEGNATKRYYNTKPLSGFSGCKIFVAEDSNGKRCVVKCSESVAYNKRLEAQFKKQSDFSALFNKLSAIRTPEIFRTYINSDGLLVGEMEYVESSFSAFEDVNTDKYVYLICEYLAQAGKQAGQTVDKTFFNAVSEKVGSIESTLFPLFNDALSILESLVPPPQLLFVTAILHWKI